MNSPICPPYLYIHWPFCSFKCHYCDFVAFQEHEGFQKQYHEALIKELITFSQQCATDDPRTIKTVFIGGGTPSLYPLEWMRELFDVLHKYYDMSSVQEITIETNPADIDEEKLECWADLGINRISVGVQSLNDDVLLKLNRRQRATDVHRVMKIAPKYIPNISIDLILGLPEVSTEEWFATIDQVLTWPLQHLSIYFLTIHEKTPLYFSVQKGAVTLADDDQLVGVYQETINRLERGGIIQYEVSNFARNGAMSIHNQAYWKHYPYKGFGVGSSSFDRSRRTINTNNLNKYLNCAQNLDWDAQATHENITPEQARLELLMLGLRQKCGVNLHDMVYLTGSEDESQVLGKLKELIIAGLVEPNTTATIRLTSKGMALENEVVLRLL